MRNWLMSYLLPFTSTSLTNVDRCIFYANCVHAPYTGSQPACAVSYQECAGGVADTVILLCRVGCRNGLRELGVTKRSSAARGAIWYNFL